jgi:hypothetical protein
MKNFLVLIAMVCSVNMFSIENKMNDDLASIFIYTTCGTVHEIADTGQTWNQIFDISEGLDWYECQGGRQMLQMVTYN